MYVIALLIPPDQFYKYSEPDQVKIVWTLEVEEIDAKHSRFSTETRAVATDESSRIKFCRYWWIASVGILAIRWLLLPAIKKEAQTISKG